MTYFISFFFNDSAPAGFYTLSLHDALPISRHCPGVARSFSGDPFLDPAGPRALHRRGGRAAARARRRAREMEDRKSTRLNSSHVEISYAVFCLKKKKTTS